MKLSWNKANTIVACMLGATVLFGTGYKAWTMKANAAEMRLVAMRLDQKILQDRRDWLEYKIDQLERKQNKTESDWQDLRKYKQQLRDVEKRLDAITSFMVGKKHEEPV